MSQNYCVGFAFDSRLEKVYLIRKERPRWQRGCLNGPGGHVEGGETFLGAMVREFREETGVDHKHWTLVAEGFTDSTLIHFFATRLLPGAVPQTKTDERIESVSLCSLFTTNKNDMINNLPMLIGHATAVLLRGAPYMAFRLF